MLDAGGDWIFSSGCVSPETYDFRHPAHRTRNRDAPDSVIADFLLHRQGFG